MLLSFGICFIQHFDTRYLVFYNPSSPRMFCPWTFFQNIGFNTVLTDPFVTCHISLLNLDIPQGSFRLCNWLSLRRLVSWINHLPPVCWSTFWKSNFKQQLGCGFDIMDDISFLCLFWHVQFYASWYIRSFFGFTFLNILYFFKYSCTNIFHRRSLYTFYISIIIMQDYSQALNTYKCL